MHTHKYIHRFTSHKSLCLWDILMGGNPCSWDYEPWFLLLKALAVQFSLDNQNYLPKTNKKNPPNILIKQEPGTLYLKM